VTAPDRNREFDAGPFSAASAVVVRHIDETSLSVIDGRRAARALAKWARRFELAEAEFQLLWCLRSVSGVGLDQTTLAATLAFSPAQVSAIVERVRARDWICQPSAASDRRRRLWRLSASGRNLLEHMVSAAALLRYDASAREGAPGEAAA
jgi:DNA-binding MarR family transcriptional regulator